MHNEEKKPLTQETTLENLHHRRTEVCQLFRLTGANKMQQETLKSKTRSQHKQRSTLLIRSIIIT